MRDDLNLIEWLNHLQEELMDATLYIEKLKSEVKTNKDAIIELSNIDKDDKPFTDRLMEEMTKKQNDMITKLMNKDKG